jgi:hypothetical protein
MKFSIDVYLLKVIYFCFVYIGPLYQLLRVYRQLKSILFNFPQNRLLLK